MKRILALPVLVVALALCGVARGGGKPNIIFILTDDQGYGDISAHGNPVLKTPNLDRLHGESVRFTDFHVSPTCAPTRSALLTGRHEFRNGVTHTVEERERLAPDAVTLAQVLRRAGYATGIFGKWHLGDEPAYQPGKRGFDETFIHGAGGIGQSYAGSCGDAPGNTYFDPLILHNGGFVRTRGFCTDIFFAHAIEWMDEQLDAHIPFVAWIATNAPHEPLSCPPEYERPYAGRVPAKVATFFGMIANIDENVGRVLAKLEEWGIAEKTLVIFMNDNGGTNGVGVWNAGMRGQKVTPWLGGTRAASFWRWPGTLTPGDRPQLAAHIDFFPTLAEIAGAELGEKERAQIEGRSLAPLLRDPAAAWPERTLFTHVGRWKHGGAAGAKYLNCAVRTPRWHLVNVDAKAVKAWQLFDVQADPGEQRDVAAEHAEVVRDLDAAYDRWWDSVQPQLVNENAVPPKENAFATLYRAQFGALPKPAEK